MSRSPSMSTTTSKSRSTTTSRARIALPATSRSLSAAGNRRPLARSDLAGLLGDARDVVEHAGAHGGREVPAPAHLAHVQQARVAEALARAVGAAVLRIAIVAGVVDAAAGAGT